jgi:hypothetical protein
MNETLLNNDIRNVRLRPEGKCLDYTTESLRYIVDLPVGDQETSLSFKEDDLEN